MMTAPNDSDLLGGATVTRMEGGGIDLSEFLVDLFVAARSSYDWPEGTGAAKSELAVIQLEQKVESLAAQVDAAAAHSIVTAVSTWGGNNAVAKRNISSAGPEIEAKMLAAVQQILADGGLTEGLNELSMVPGLDLVMATKIYRFCCAGTGAAVDRHASYFFNSLDLVDLTGTRRKATAFRREWATGKHTKSRLATYNPPRRERNRVEFTEVYLPFLSEVAYSLNRYGATYTCAATGAKKWWRPADVEMAAYYWWARNGMR